MSCSDEQSDSFAQHQLHRLLAFNGICSQLRTHYLAPQPAPWPEGALPYVADIAFADGAAYLTANEDGAIEVIQQPAKAAGLAVPLSEGRRRSTLWKHCLGKETTEFIDSHIPSEQLVDLGLSLPDRSSVMVQRMESRYRPISCICVWRSPEGGRQHSRDPYQVWDQQEFQIASHFIATTVDLHEYVKTAVQLKGIQDAARALLDVIKPVSIEMYSLKNSLPEPAAERLEQCLLALDAGVNCTQRRLMFLGQGGRHECTCSA